VYLYLLHIVVLNSSYFFVLIIYAKLDKRQMPL
jgi:hypothetical protein